MSEPSPIQLSQVRPEAADQAGLPSVIHYLNRGDSYRLGPPEQ